MSFTSNPNGRHHGHMAVAGSIHPIQAFYPIIDGIYHNTPDAQIQGAQNTTRHTKN